jgi:hypothetical protein
MRRKSGKGCLPPGGIPHICSDCNAKKRTMRGLLFWKEGSGVVNPSSRPCPTGRNLRRLPPRMRARSESALDDRRAQPRSGYRRLRFPCGRDRHVSRLMCLPPHGTWDAQNRAPKRHRSSHGGTASTAIPTGTVGGTGRVWRSTGSTSWATRRCTTAISASLLSGAQQSPRVITMGLLLQL